MPQLHNNSVPVHYRGNPMLKRAGVKLGFTPEQQEEFNKCASDPIYFILNYVKIVHVDHGLIPFKLRKYQYRMLEAMFDNRHVIMKCVRQCGKSTTVAGYFLWQLIFKEYFKTAIVGHEEGVAKEILSRIKLAYEHLPFWLQQGVVEWNKKSIELENGSACFAGATSSDGIRGRSYSMVLLDEFAFVAEGIAENFMKSIFPTISSGETTKVVIVSTCNGLNHYYKMWTNAEKGENEYHPVEVSWNEVPQYTEAFKAKIIKTHGQSHWDSEYGNEFLGSQNTLIKSSKLKSLVNHTPVTCEDDFWIYEEPQDGHVYVSTVDCAEGLGLDYSVVNIIDITEYPHKQVAIYRSNEISSIELPDKIISLSKYYNEAFVLVEVESIGHQVAKDIYHDLEYENLIYISSKNGQEEISNGFSGKAARYGLGMNKKTKRIGCTNLKPAIERDKLILTDECTINELYSFIKHDNGTFAADEGKHDDCVMGLVIYAWLINQTYFKSLTEQKLLEEINRSRSGEKTPEELLFGFINDGQSDYEQNKDGWEEIETPFIW